MEESKNERPDGQGPQGNLDSLTDEQRGKAKTCKTPEELTALAAKEGVELPDEMLDAIAGGYIYKNADRNYIRAEWQVIADDNGDVMKRCLDKDAAESGAAFTGIDFWRSQMIKYPCTFGAP